jgi:hypothetical protein
MCCAESDLGMDDCQDRVTFRTPETPHTLGIQLLEVCSVIVEDRSGTMRPARGEGVDEA